MALNESFNKSVQSGANMRLAKLNAVPSIEDLSFALSLAAKNPRHTVELPWKAPTSPANYIIRVNCSRSPDEPTWMLNMENEEDQPELWNYDTPDASLIHSLITAESERATYKSPHVIEPEFPPELVAAQMPGNGGYATTGAQTVAMQAAPANAPPTQTAPAPQQSLFNLGSYQSGLEQGAFTGGFDQFNQPTTSQPSPGGLFPPPPPGYQALPQAQPGPPQIVPPQGQFPTAPQPPSFQQALAPAQIQQPALPPAPPLPFAGTPPNEQNRAPEGPRLSAVFPSQPAASGVPPSAEVTYKMPASKPLPPPINLDRVAVDSIYASFTSTETGFISHAAFLFFLVNEFGRFQREPKPLSVVRFELCLKEGNRLQPLPVQAVRECGRRMFSVMRSLDWAAHYESENALLLPYTNRVQARELVQKICQTILSAPLLPGLDPSQVGLFFGISCMPDDCSHPGILLSSAESAKVHAKETNTQVVTFGEL